VAFLVISNLATFSWTSLRLRRNVRLGAILAVALLGGALINATWETLTASALFYLLLIPFSVASYGRVKRQRAATASHRPGTGEPSPVEPTA
jgi:CDP-diacylglycerol--serine O-phosphatidyltransferase